MATLETQYANYKSSFLDYKGTFEEWKAMRGKALSEGLIEAGFFKPKENKSYFTKFLPVEGHFHYVGAYIRHKKTGQIGKIKKVGEGIDETQYEHVKLFLCSRDIQVGDKVIDIDDNSTILTVVEGNGKTQLNLPDNEIVADVAKGLQCIKVIGEISPDALGYVKEGDEFDNNQLIKHIHYIYGENGSGRRMCNSIDEQLRVGEPSNIGDYLITNIGRIDVFVKGPCGHFH